MNTKSITTRLSQTQDPNLRMDYYLRAVREYKNASEATKRKWRKTVLENRLT